jgi:hypothetical protein
MADDQTPFEVAPGAAARVGQEVNSPDAPPGMTFDEIERQLYAYICASLKAEGIQHMTAGMPIAVIVRTYRDWLKACDRCETEGRVQTSAKGWSAPTPWAEDEKRLKMELGQWLPKACLTIPSFTRVKKDSGASGVQDDLFGDLVAHGQNSAVPGLPH